MAEQAGEGGRTAGVPVRLRAADGYRLGATLCEQPGASRPIVVIAPATSVRARYYARFAGWLADHGFDVLTFDYRGIGESRPARLRDFHAGWVDWGEQDLDAALGFAAARGLGRALHVVAHSIGGFAVGLAPSAVAVSRIVTVGSQFAHWRDYDPAARRAMYLKWHVAMPALAALFGYVPARRLGWMEDTPAGVARDWSRMGGRFEASLRRHDPAAAAALPARFAALRAPLLAISLTDDPFGTIAATERLLGYFTGCPRTHLRLAPAEVGETAIGHFAFFHERFRPTLWPLALEWLARGALPPGHAGKLLPVGGTEEGTA
ncbi:alpha/beta hydrolase family protein [Ancylobacter lacus]|uniref:alpha/beta hydrolase family protein n=1 Tax=Ancylobacter lacus TaxID=2579970 RepID=UPI001BCBB286|nr:alpha/beta fold hydrolase [Ancylobacter lacus]MBS7540982.1 alpha/beta fold hydrolase [Ancylobacter lacus]